MFDVSEAVDLAVATHISLGTVTDESISRDRFTAKLEALRNILNPYLLDCKVDAMIVPRIGRTTMMLPELLGRFNKVLEARRPVTPPLPEYSRLMAEPVYDTHSSEQLSQWQRHMDAVAVLLGGDDASDPGLYHRGQARGTQKHNFVAMKASLLERRINHVDNRSSSAMFLLTTTVGSYITRNMMQLHRGLPFLDQAASGPDDKPTKTRFINIEPKAGLGDETVLPYGSCRDVPYLGGDNIDQSDSLAGIRLEVKRCDQYAVME